MPTHVKVRHPSPFLDFFLVDVFMLNKLIAATLALVVTTFAFSMIMYETDKADRMVIAEKIRNAFDDGELLKSLFPAAQNIWTRDNLSGLDQSVESFYALMIMYRDTDHPWRNAVNPGLYQAVDDGIPLTEQADLCSTAKEHALDDRAYWTIGYKPRFWHGVKAVLLAALPHIELSQLQWLIKISTFFAFAMIAVQVMFLDRAVGLAYTAFTFSAFYCSSVFFFGGVAYSVPLMAIALWGVVWLAFRMTPLSDRRSLEIFVITVGGTLFSFFFQLGGCEIYALSLIIFVEIFVSPGTAPTKRLQRMVESCVFLLIGFFGSIILKHLLIVVLTGSFDAVTELIEKIILRTSDTNDFGTRIGFLDIVTAQFYWYGIASYGVQTLFVFVNFSKYVAGALLCVVPVWLLLLGSQGQREELRELLVAFIGFFLMLATVILRYMLLRNHSDIHVFFVDRYLFVFAGTAYFFLLWLLISSGRLLPRPFGRQRGAATPSA